MDVTRLDLTRCFTSAEDFAKYVRERRKTNKAKTKSKPVVETYDTEINCSNREISSVDCKTNIDTAKTNGKTAIKIEPIETTSRDINNAIERDATKPITSVDLDATGSNSFDHGLCSHTSPSGIDIETAGSNHRPVNEIAIERDDTASTVLYLRHCHRKTPYVADDCPQERETNHIKDEPVSPTEKNCFDNSLTSPHAVSIAKQGKTNPITTESRTTVKTDAPDTPNSVDIRGFCFDVNQINTEPVSLIEASCVAPVPSSPQAVCKDVCDSKTSKAKTENDLKDDTETISESDKDCSSTISNENQRITNPIKTESETTVKTNAPDAPKSVDLRGFCFEINKIKTEPVSHTEKECVTPLSTSPNAVFKKVKDVVHSKLNKATTNNETEVAKYHTKTFSDDDDHRNSTTAIATQCQTIPIITEREATVKTESSDAFNSVDLRGFRFDPHQVIKTEPTIGKQLVIPLSTSSHTVSEGACDEKVNRATTDNNSQRLSNPIKTEKETTVKTESSDTSNSLDLRGFCFRPSPTDQHIKSETTIEKNATNANIFDLIGHHLSSSPNTSTSMQNQVLEANRNTPSEPIIEEDTFSDNYHHPSNVAIEQKLEIKEEMETTATHGFDLGLPPVSCAHGSIVQEHVCADPFIKPACPRSLKIDFSVAPTRFNRSRIIREDLRVEPPKETPRVRLTSIQCPVCSEILTNIHTFQQHMASHHQAGEKRKVGARKKDKDKTKIKKGVAKKKRVRHGSRANPRIANIVHEHLGLEYPKKQHRVQPISLQTGERKRGPKFRPKQNQLSKKPQPRYRERYRGRVPPKKIDLSVPPVTPRADVVHGTLTS